ncbi:cytochrome subunit of sulfide dehydrogenase [Rhodopseudomonas palustris HaA2]|uniref:Cytochrome subunit of sulfide dehydrogenase n=1 Tax=Rhodopseudomonas palustris (strain HaA2) TaxID=316058 RepID=Q2IRV8_RHOP2|nr:c-type cytochrome [Rhodopseudomonas palustris]ABD09052.1 cytochrome subunit of sulfide dehydrogenase [Rhodopseudomonas palustris HaA2]
MATTGQAPPRAARGTRAIRAVRAMRPARGVSAALRAAVAGVALCGAASAAAAGDRELGEYLSSECVTCHQLSGRFDGIPSIVGRAEPELIEALTEYRAKLRDNQVMRAIAAKFNDEEIAALASYFGSLEQDKNEHNIDRTGDVRAFTSTMEGKK